MEPGGDSTEEEHNMKDNKLQNIRQYQKYWEEHCEGLIDW